MSEFEMAYMHSELYSAVQQSMTIFFTMLTGFLVASYVAAHRLTRTVASAGLFLYSMYMLINVMGTSSQLMSYARLSEAMHAYIAAGKGLAWHGTATVPLAVVSALSPAFLLGGPLMILASIYFFFHCRRVNRKAEAGAWKPKA